MKAKNVANPKEKSPEQISAEVKEEWIQSYAKYLDEVYFCKLTLSSGNFILHKYFHL